MRQQEIITHKVDWVTVMLYAVMVIWGWLNIYSASYDENQTFLDPSLNSTRQLVYIAGCVILILIILIMDMRFYETFAYFIYGAIIFILLLVPVIGK